MARPTAPEPLLALVAALLALAPAVARADSVVLIVANNRSLRSHLPDLQYADDDGIRYYQLWESLLPEARLALLADPDASTARANPSFVRLGRPPIRANVRVEAAALAEAVRQARQAGRSTTFYFVFAGHGDVESGRGFLELADGRFHVSDLEEVINQVGADRTHVILDSCNSYFMVRPRKPGGRPLAGGLNQATAAPFAGSDRVGAFLSTSSEQTVYEWSEIQSGIFSYLVRSGLMGGADANDDGRISYNELRGFVGVASRTVPNPAVRPHVYASAPGGDGDTILIDLNEGNARPLKLPSGQRFVLRNAEGFRLAEVHTEPDFGPKIRLWGGPELRLEQVVAPRGPGGRPARLTFDIPDSGPVRFEELVSQPPSGQTRGGNRMFQALFENPFGPLALASQLEEERASPPAIYGLSRADTDRLRLNLNLLGQTKRHDRLGTALWQGLVAAALGALAIDTATGDSPTCAGNCTTATWVLGSTAAFFGGLTIWNLVPGAMERLADGGRRSIASGSDPALWLPQLGQDLDRLAARARLRGRILAGLLGAMFTLNAVSSVIEAVEARRVTTEIAWQFTFWSALTASSMWLVLQESPAERQIRALKADPLWQGISLAVAPSSGGFRLALGMRF